MQIEKIIGQRAFAGYTSPLSNIWLPLSPHDGKGESGRTVKSPPHSDGEGIQGRG
jgi:hypothetical protein